MLFWVLLDLSEANTVKRLRYENGDLDATDAHILGALVDDARISIADLARSVGLSPPSVSEGLSAWRKSA